MHYLLITFCIPLMTLAVVYSQHWVEVCLRLQLGLCCLNIIISFISKYTAEFKGQPHHNPQPAFLYWSQGMQNVLWEYKILQGTPAGQQDVLHENAELIVRVCKSTPNPNPIKKTSVFPKGFIQMGLLSFFSGICKTKIMVMQNVWNQRQYKQL